MDDDLSAARDDETALRQKVHDGLARVAQAEPLRERERQLEGALHGASEGTARAVDAASLAASLSATGLHIERLVMDDVVSRSDAFETRTAQVRLSGSFEQFARLAEHLALVDGGFVLHAMTWTAQPDAKGVGLESSVDLVRPLTDTERQARTAQAKRAKR